MTEPYVAPSTSNYFKMRWIDTYPGEVADLVGVQVEHLERALGREDVTGQEVEAAVAVVEHAHLVLLRPHARASREQEHGAAFLPQRHVFKSFKRTSFIQTILLRTGVHFTSKFKQDILFYSYHLYHRNTERGFQICMTLSLEALS